MVFDLCAHQKTQIIINAAILRRREIGLPEENNITILYNEMAPLLGITVVQMNSRTADHLPSPAEMRNKDGGSAIPNKPCPKCGKTTFLNWICQTCEAAENGLYKTGYTCDERSGGCGFVDEKTGEFYSQRLSRMGVEIPTGMKQAMGIQTLTDKGLE